MDPRGLCLAAAGEPGHPPFAQARRLEAAGDARDDRRDPERAQGLERAGDRRQRAEEALRTADGADAVAPVRRVVVDDAERTAVGYRDSGRFGMAGSPGRVEAGFEIGENAVLVENATLQGQRVRPLSVVTEQQVPYFSLIIAGRQRSRP